MAHRGRRFAQELGVGICTDREHGVVVTLDADYGPNLTPQRAREVGLQLLQAAAWVEDHRDE